MSDRSTGRRPPRPCTLGLGRATSGWAMAGTTAIAVLCGCHEYSTRIRVSDPSDVALHAGKADEQSDLVLPAGKEAKSVVYLSEPPITASRGPAGTLRLSCSACEFGDLVLVEPSGTFRPIESAADDLIAPEARARGELEASQSLVTSSAVYGGGSTTTIVTHSIRPVLKTRWSNVAEIEEQRTPMRFVGWLNLIPGVILTGTGLLVMPHSSTAGTALLVPGIGFDASWIYHAFFPTKTTAVYRAAK